MRAWELPFEAEMAPRDTKDALLEAGLALSSELSLGAVLQRIVKLAMELTSARYGALGVLGPGDRIIEFLTVGVTPEERRTIGHPPEGHGVLGVLIKDARPKADLARHHCAPLRWLSRCGIGWTCSSGRTLMTRPCTRS